MLAAKANSNIWKAEGKPEQRRPAARSLCGENNEIFIDRDRRLVKMAKTFRHSAGFGKRIEYWIIGQMLKEGLDVYVPLVDDDAIDAVIRRKDGSFVTVQIKARSNDVVLGDASLFAAIPHELRENYWFVFYSERMEMIWIMTSKEFIKECVQNKIGKNVGKRSIWFNGTKMDKINGGHIEYCKDRYQKYVAKDFSRLANN